MAKILNPVYGFQKKKKKKKNLFSIISFFLIFNYSFAIMSAMLIVWKTKMHIIVVNLNFDK